METLTWKEDNKSDLINHGIHDSEMAILQHFRDNLFSLLLVNDLQYTVQGKKKVTSSELASIYPAQRHWPIKYFILERA